MTGKSHLKIGIAVGALTLNPCVIIGSAIGSLLPDIDHKGSTISRITHVHLPVHHRGITHSIIGLGIIYLLLVYLCGGTNAYIQGIVIGYISHLIADSITIRGIHLFFPKKIIVGLPIIKTGGIGEKIISNIVVIMVIITLVM